MGSAFRNASFGSPAGMFPFGVKWLLIGNTAIFLLQFVLYQGLGIPLNFLKLIPAQTVTGYIWQPFTYMFLHDVHGPVRKSTTMFQRMCPDPWTSCKNM